MSVYKLLPVQYTQELPRWVIISLLITWLSVMYITDFLDIYVFMNIRCLLWIAFYYTCYKSGLLTRFGYIQQFLYIILTSFASLSFLYTLSHYFRPEYLDWFGYNDFKDEVIKQTNDTIFVFTSIVVITFLILYPKVRWEKSFEMVFEKEELIFYKKLAIVLFVLGYVFVIIKLGAPAALYHTLHVCSLLSLGSFPILLVIYKTYKDNGETDKATFILWLLILFVLLYGGTSFLFKGSKGKLFNLLVLVGIFSVTYFRFSLLKLIGYFALITFPLLYFLPFFLNYKNASSQGQLNTVSDRVDQFGNYSNSIENKNTKMTNQFDYTINYLAVRAVMATATLKYTQYRLFQGDNLVSENVYPNLVETILPRFLINDKFDFNGHYNDMARLVGIGNYNDYSTSRKPNIMEEGIVFNGKTGVVLFAIITGIFLVVLTNLSLINTGFNLFPIVFVCLSHPAANLIVIGDILSFMVFQAGFIFFLLLITFSLMKFYKVQWIR